jgi:hypothetical protein
MKDATYILNRIEEIKSKKNLYKKDTPDDSIMRSHYDYVILELQRVLL